MALVTLADVVAALGGDLHGDAATTISKIGPLEAADAATLSFLANPRYRAQLPVSLAGCVIVAPEFAELAAARGAAIITPDPYLYFARLTQWWVSRTRPVVPACIHPSAVIDASAQLAEGVAVGPLAVIEAGVVIEAGAIVIHGVTEPQAVSEAVIRRLERELRGSGRLAAANRARLKRE